MSKIDIRTLTCGVRVVMEKIDYVQSAAFGVWVKAGACDENKQNAGVSHFIEHMMFKGTEKRNARQIAEEIDRIGGQINGTRGSVLHTFVFAFSANTKEASQSSLQRIAIDIMIGSHALSSPLKPRTFCALRPCLLADLPVCFCIYILDYTTFFRA